MQLTIEQLQTNGLTEKDAKELLDRLALVDSKNPQQAWSAISQILANNYPFAIHQLVFSEIYPHWRDHPETAAAWLPTPERIKQANISQVMASVHVDNVKAFHAWTTKQYQDFWLHMIEKLKIAFKQKPKQVCDLSKGLESPQWFPGAQLNIVDSCFTAPANATALLYHENNQIKKITYSDLEKLVNQISNSLVQQGFTAGDAIAIAMPMNPFAVAIYLGIIKMGGVVVSIADSFSSQEIATRLRIANAKAIFTQDVSIWGNKKIPLYPKIRDVQAKKIIVIPHDPAITLELRAQDISWQEFLVNETEFNSVACDPMTPCNILFSSGTTGDPKAIIWNHTTGIKCASDGFLHQNIQSQDVIVWPTNLGWMMGPWLIFAALINHATIGLYTEAPKDETFGQFIRDAKVTILGVVPTLVAAWRQSGCMENLDWSAIKTFTSTGECSNPNDMLYLMSLAGYKPIIEYCGGTEIGGAYVTSTVVENNCPSVFTTKAMGMDFAILDEHGKPTTNGEVAIIPPSIGLSTQLVNKDHHDTYYADMPTTKDGKLLRRHGDQIKQTENGSYIVLGRVDDTMNLGGIKTSSAEIERSVIGMPDIIETAAISIPPPDNGPNLLVIYATTNNKTVDKQQIQKSMQQRINQLLNPLFRIHDVVFVKELPKTASNKVMRRMLRREYMGKNDSEQT